MNDEPCMCGTDFTCLADHGDAVGGAEKDELACGVSLQASRVYAKSLIRVLMNEGHITPHAADKIRAALAGPADVEDERARAYMERSEAAQPTTWCIECGGPSDVLDEGRETSPDGRDFWVRCLDCGHEEAAEPGTVT